MIDKENYRMKIILNPNKELVHKIDEGLAKNGGYCPCSIFKDETTKCMCTAFRNQKEPGPCHCGKFVKIND